MISNGFADLAEGNPALAYRVIVDLLAGINDNDSVRRHLSASTQLFPRGSLRKSIRMTDRGPVLAQMHASGPSAPVNGAAAAIAGPPLVDDDSGSDAESSSPDSASQQRGPIAEMLYSRWLDGLRRATGLY